MVVVPIALGLRTTTSMTIRGRILIANMNGGYGYIYVYMYICTWPMLHQCNSRVVQIIFYFASSLQGWHWLFRKSFFNSLLCTGLALAVLKITQAIQTDGTRFGQSHSKGVPESCRDVVYVMG